MRLAPGTRLGPYEIVAPLGAGGMGEVYRARDTRLDRTVALKILPQESTASPEAAARFEREARAISRFSHRHICQLHDVGNENGTAFLVMELVDGETLADRLAKGPLAFVDVRRYAIEIADALDAAHRAGIVHRDLKPGNVMLPKSGLKLLDFGLAKSSAIGTAATITPTLAPVTTRGSVTGTVAYMAPEVLDGQPADERSDIFALGAVIYEMATGQRHFNNATRAVSPDALDRIVRGCLARDPEERWQSARDVRLQLAALSDAAPAGASGGRRSTRLAWTVAAVALAAAAGSLLVRPGAATRAAPIAFEVAPPDGGTFVDSVEAANPALSPDGSQIAFIASDATGVTHAWLRPLSNSQARPLAGTEGARHVFWAPNGKSLGFAAGDKLKRIDLPDGTPVTLSDVPDVRINATWGDGQIVYAILPGGIHRIPLSGGASTDLLQPDPAKHEIAVAWPWFLPDGKRLLYVVRHTDGSGAVRILEPGKPPRDIVRAASMVQVLDGAFLVYARDSTLVAQPFDLLRATVTGEPIPIAEPVRYFQPTGAATFSVSQSGVLVYQSHPERGRLVWLDRSGGEVGSIGDDSGYSRVRISPDGHRILFSRVQSRFGTAQIWDYDADRQVEQRLTSDLFTTINPMWLPNGAGVLYAGGVPPHLIRKDFATGAERELLPGVAFTLPEALSPDGRTLIFTQRTPRGTFDIWATPLDDLSKRTRVRETPFDEAAVRFSPDGRYLAYAANGLGQYEIFVEPYPPSGSPIRVSTAGGAQPRCRRDGRELFYLSGDGWLVSVPVSTTPLFTTGAPQRLFAVQGGVLWADIKTNSGWPDYDVAPDGSRFLAAVPLPANRRPLTVMINWHPPQP
jgi:eukaryotic-like serine/threonine-protein kinase